MRRSTLKKIVGFGAGLLLTGAALLVGTGFVVVTQTRAHIVDLAEAPERDVAIVLGAGLARPGVPGPVLVDRLQLALDLYTAGHVDKILVSGDNDGVGIDEVNPMRRWLVDRGVPSDDVFMDHAGFRTLDTMKRAVHVFEVDNAIICTQSFHLGRSVYLARSSGIDAVGVPAPHTRWRTTRTARVREAAAWGKAVLDVTLGIGPRYYGDRIPIATSHASATHDSRT